MSLCNRMAKCLSVTNMTGLLLSVLSGIDLALLFFILLFYKKICLKECEVLRKVFSNKIFVTLVIQGLPWSFFSRPVA